jgi:hypothetical protein
MANTIKVKRSAVPTKVPTTSDLDLGEIAVNTYDGKMYIKKDDGTPAIIQIGAGGGAGDVTGPGSSTDNALARFDSTTGKIIQNSVGILDDSGNLTGINSITDPDYVTFNTAYATGLTTGQLGWDSTNNSLAFGMANGNIVQHIGEDQYLYIKASATITKGQVIMFTGSVGASGVLTGAPATGITDGTYIIGIAAEAIANNAFGFVQTFGVLTNVNTSAFADGDILWYDPSVTGGLTATKPSAPNIKAQVAACNKGGSAGGGVITVRVNPGSQLGGTDSNVQFGTLASGQTIIYDATAGYWKNSTLTAGTGISISNGAGSITVTNSAPDQTVAISGTSPVSVSGTYPSFTVSMTQSSGSVNGWLSSTDWTTFNGKQNTLVSGTDIKTVNGTTLLGSGDLGTIGSAYGGTGFSTYATGDLVYASATNTLSKLTAGTNGYVLTLAGGVPTWAAATGGGTAFSPYQFIATASQTTFAVGVTLSVIQVFVSGVLQKPTADYTISGTNVVLTSGVAVNTIVSVYVYDTFSVANTYTQSAADALFAPQISPTFVTPALGTPSSGNLTNCTFPTLNQNTTGNAGTVTNGLYTTGNQTITARNLQQGSQNVGTLRTSSGSLGGLELLSAGSGNAAFMTFHKPGNYASYFGIDTDNYFAVGGWSAGAGLANFKCNVLSKGSGSFCIDHPLPALEKTHNLIHSFVEAPQADNLYRGKITLVNGKANVNIDEIAGMTDGTFVLLNREVQCFTSNETDWDAVRGFINKNILTIECQNQNSTATISWLVIGERKDKHMYDTDWTDENGKVIVEPLKKTTALDSDVDLT